MLQKKSSKGKRQNRMQNKPFFLKKFERWKITIIKHIIKNAELLQQKTCDKIKKIGI